MEHAVILDFVRSPCTPVLTGALAGLAPAVLSGTVVRCLAGRSGVPLADIEAVVWGAPAADGASAWQTVLAAGLPRGVAGVPAGAGDDASMRAIHQGAGAIAMGAGHILVCGGARILCAPAGEVPGQTGPGSGGTGGAAGPGSSGTGGAAGPGSSGTGAFFRELVPVAGAEETVSGDVHPAVTGDSLPMVDGAAALLLCGETRARASGLDWLARIGAAAVSGGPVVAGEPAIVRVVRKLLARANLTVEAIDLFGLDGDGRSREELCAALPGIAGARLNPPGAAAPVTGHAGEASGALLAGRTALLLARQGAGRAIVAQPACDGQAIAILLERHRD